MRDLIDYAVEKMRATNHNPNFFGNVLSYVPTWSALAAERQESAQRRASAARCPICQGRGVVVVTAADGSEIARRCNHGEVVDNNDQSAVH